MTTVVGSIRAERRHTLTIPAPATLAATGLALVAAVLYSWIGLFRHDHFGSNAFDLGIQDQTVWGYSQFQMLPNTILGIPNLLGDDFHPILFVLAPLYWLWDSPGVLLVSQAVLLALASIPIYLWGAARLGRLAALAFQASFLVFWGVLAAVVFDFHHIVFAVPGISAALYATLNRRNGLLWYPSLYEGFEYSPNVIYTGAAPNQNSFQLSEYLIQNGLIKGGSLENAVVIRDDAVLTSEPLRYPEEFVRHKILDILGDLALIGRPLLGHVIAVKPSHTANCELARQIAGATRQLGKLVARLQAIIPAGGDRVIDGKRGKRTNPRQCRLCAGKAEPRIDDDAERDANQHHAQGDQEGANAHHVANYLRFGPCPTLPVFTSAGQAASSEIAHAKRSEGPTGLL